MHVYLVTFRTSGQVWHTAVCEDNMDAVLPVLASHGIRDLHWRSDDGEFQDYINPDDQSQTASVTRRRVCTAEF